MTKEIKNPKATNNLKLHSSARNLERAAWAERDSLGGMQEQTNDKWAMGLPVFRKIEELLKRWVSKQILRKLHKLEVTIEVREGMSQG